MSRVTADKTEILLKVALNAITPYPSIVILIINIAYKKPQRSEFYDQTNEDRRLNDNK